MTFQPSAQQQAFFDCVRLPVGPSIVLEAVAGAGKTTALVEGVTRMQGDVALIVFNKKNATEIQERLVSSGNYNARRHKVSTVHSVGFAAIRALVSGITTDERKVRGILREIAADPRYSQPHMDKAISAAERLVGLAKQSLLAPTKAEAPAWAALCRRHGVEDSAPAQWTMRQLVYFAQHALRVSNVRRNEVIDFDDMVYLPAAFPEYPVKQFDWVLLDEAQDTNAARRVLARRMLKPNGRIVAVGDRHQALYAFTGADSAALDLIQEEFQAVRLPLSISYRCPQAVVAEARKHVSHIEAAPNAPMGEVRHESLSKMDLATRFLGERTSAIICRYNKPLVSLSLSLLGAGVPCRIEGRDIGKNLTTLMQRVCGGVEEDSMTYAETVSCLEEWLRVEVAQAQEKEDASREKVAQDKFDCLALLLNKMLFSHGVETRGGWVRAVCKQIEDMFADDVKGLLVLSSIHKAKGREWDTVFWLQVPPRPTKAPLKDWEIETEVCCNYVAPTRAKNTLIFLED